MCVKSGMQILLHFTLVHLKCELNYICMTYNNKCVFNLQNRLKQEACLCITDESVSGVDTSSCLLVMSLQSSTFTHLIQMKKHRSCSSETKENIQ